MDTDGELNDLAKAVPLFVIMLIAAFLVFSLFW
jgi:hypothetical protein